MAIKRVIRVLMYEGSEEWINRTLANSIQGRFDMGSSSIHEVSCTELGQTPWPRAVDRRFEKDPLYMDLPVAKQEEVE